MAEHAASNHRLTKRNCKFTSIEELMKHSSALLLPVKSVGLNPYKIIELWKNYRPMVPAEYHDDALYLKPDEETKAKVKDEKLYCGDTRLVLKAKKYGGVMDSIEQIAFGVIGDNL